MSTPEGDEIVRRLEEGSERFLKRCEEMRNTCKECGGKLTKKSVVSLKTGQPPKPEEDAFLNRSHDPARRCTKCSRLHWEHGIPVKTKYGKRVFFTKGKLVHRNQQKKKST